MFVTLERMGADRRGACCASAGSGAWRGSGPADAVAARPAGCGIAGHGRHHLVSRLPALDHRRALRLFVLILLGHHLVRFNASANPTPSRTTHNTLLEIVWTIVPVVILVRDRGPLVPAAVSCSSMCRKPDLTVKATGKQWYWSYTYPDNGNFEFNSLIVEEKDLKPDQPRLLDGRQRDGRAGQQGRARAGHRRRRHSLLRGAVVRHQDRRRSGPAQRHLVQGDKRRHVPRPMLGVVRQGSRLHADHGARGERQRVRHLGRGRRRRNCRRRAALRRPHSRLPARRRSDDVLHAAADERDASKDDRD